jgi:hypothetical protein
MPTAIVSGDAHKLDKHYKHTTQQSTIVHTSDVLKSKRIVHVTCTVAISFTNPVKTVFYCTSDVVEPFAVLLSIILCC